jgi:hypothetical protein
VTRVVVFMRLLGCVGGSGRGLWVKERVAEKWSWQESKSDAGGGGYATVYCVGGSGRGLWVIERAREG